MTDESENRLGSTDPVRDLIRHRIKELGLSYKDVSRSIGKGQTYISGYLSGAPKKLPIDVAIELSRKLEIPLANISSRVADEIEEGRRNASTRTGANDMPLVPTIRNVGDIDIKKANVWTDIPSVHYNVGACWIGEATGRLRVGETIVYHLERQAEPGDMVIVVGSRSVIAIGDLDSIQGQNARVDGSDIALHPGVDQIFVVVAILLK